MFSNIYYSSEKINSFRVPFFHAELFSAARIGYVYLKLAFVNLTRYREVYIMYVNSVKNSCKGNYTHLPNLHIHTLLCTFFFSKVQYKTTIYTITFRSGTLQEARTGIFFLDALIFETVFICYT